MFCKLTKSWINRVGLESAGITAAPPQILLYRLPNCANHNALSGKKPVHAKVRSQLFTLRTGLEPPRI